ncbi:response regulator [Rhodoferax sp.]|uniref:hybrid sensor histidine kinase/response regulator n=1 Tax=Rhodoferax sp. TaxID=50421 RepID=UPI003784810C
MFKEEALELLPALGAALRQWVAHPDDAQASGESLRLLHTLKGSARLAGAMGLGELAHRMESDIESLGQVNLRASQLEPLLSQCDDMQSALDALDAASEVVFPTPEAMAQAGTHAANTTALVVTSLRPLASQSVRVRSQLLDRLVNQAGEILISRSRVGSRVSQLRASLGDMAANLDRLRRQLRDLELQAETQMQSRLGQHTDHHTPFDPLELDRFTRVQELTRMMSESVNDVATVQLAVHRAVQGAEDDLVAQGHQARELQRDLLRTRMVEFDAVSERLHGVVRQAAKELGKQVRLEVLGGSIEMDRSVLDRLLPAFEHLLRNAVAHGIEDAASRVAAGKPEVGTVTVALQQERNEMMLSFKDDGAGLQMQRIVDKAVAAGRIPAGYALNVDEALSLLLSAGFSTAERVTALSGRGIGMDVVGSEVQSLGGRIEAKTAPGQGTEFVLVLPLTTSIHSVVMLRLGDFTMGVPSNLMESVQRVPLQTLAQAYADKTLDVAGQAIPFYWAGALLQQQPTRIPEANTKSVPVAVFRSAGQRVAMHVDEVLGNREVVVKNLGRQLSRLAGLTGVSVLASGAVVLLYNPVALANVYGDTARAAQSDSSSSPSAASGAPTLHQVTDHRPLVLVVDDSVTVRRVTQRLLVREGFRVALAQDGFQALEMLADELPAVILSDIEMPRMDGFELVRNLRANPVYASLPVIMITSRIAQKHRDHANALGVDHYLGKPYPEDELLGLVRDYCAESDSGTADFLITP